MKFVKEVSLVGRQIDLGGRDTHHRKTDCGGQTQPVEDKGANFLIRRTNIQDKTGSLDGRDR